MYCLMFGWSDGDRSWTRWSLRHSIIRANAKLPSQCPATYLANISTSLAKFSGEKRETCCILEHCVWFGISTYCCNTKVQWQIVKQNNKKWPQLVLTQHCCTGRWATSHTFKCFFEVRKTEWLFLVAVKSRHKKLCITESPRLFLLAQPIPSNRRWPAA